MGYSTDFHGRFKLDRPLDDETYNLLVGLNRTRRIKRDIGKLAERLGITPEEALRRYGEEGEFFIKEKNFVEQLRDPDVVDYNEPPGSQPGFYCHWVPTEDRLYIEWDGGEKFYFADDWIVYLIDRILAPRGYKLNGFVRAFGEDPDDIWAIQVRDNKVKVMSGIIVYKLLDDVFISEDGKYYVSGFLANLAKPDVCKITVECEVSKS